MAAVRRADTVPELALRRALWSVGLRGWRNDVRGLPGRPDICFTCVRLAIFVDGAFWHGHASKYRLGIAGDYWDAKIQGNRLRDRLANRVLRKLGWEVLRIWDFEVTKDAMTVARRVRLRYHARRNEVRRQRMSKGVR